MTHPEAPLGEHVRTDTGWEIVDRHPTDDRLVTVGSNFMVGNGYLGYRGTRPEHRAAHFVGCVVSDTYDTADGVWRELCTVPNALFASVRIDAEPLTFDPTQPAEIELGCRAGELTSRWTATTASGTSALVSMRRFASLDQLHLVRQQLTVVPSQDATITFEAGVDTEVWSLNGDHFVGTDVTEDATGWTTRSVTGEDAVTIAVVGHTKVAAGGDVVLGGGGERVSAVRDGLHVHELPLAVRADDVATLDSVMVVVTSNDLAHGTGCLPAGDDPVDVAKVVADAAASSDYDTDLGASATRWQAFWSHADVEIDGDLAAQAALRFSTIHHRFATPAHSDRLPIGARGLSCQAYQGAAFWDQEMFNLPSYLVSEPDLARNLLVYRWRTLDGARRKAERLGYQGAYYAWISGDTGDELCPDFFFEDVLTGRPIRNHFNVWQMHVSPDIAVTAWRYWQVTRDLDFLVDHGAEILVEVARFLRSFVRYDEVRDRYEVIRLLGPDEWHENVDNDAYTNRMVHLALDAAIDAHGVLVDEAPEQLATLLTRLAVEDTEIDAWRRVRDRLYVPAPDPATGLIEQFDGFFGLEDARPDDLRPRLLDPSEYWGWPNGVAVHTQVSKQPAVVQLFAVDPGAAPLEVQRANYDFYEPRCAHGSSLSHSVHAIVASRFVDLDRRYLDEAYDAFMQTATLDLTASHHATVGGTFIGGMHTAANAGAYGTVVYGFGGVAIDDDGVRVDPRLPAHWEGLRFPVVARGQRLTVTADHDRTIVEADPDNTDSVAVRLGGASVGVLEPGRSVTARSHG